MSFVLTQGDSKESPLPLWERDRVRGLAPAGADESIAASADGRPILSDRDQQNPSLGTLLETLQRG